jgi:transmembrane sensor
MSDPLDPSSPFQLPDLPPGIDGAVLVRYFSGDCAPAEVARIDAWVAGAPGRRAELDALRAVWELSARELSGAEPNVSGAWAAVQARIRKEAPVLALHVGGTRSRRARWTEFSPAGDRGWAWTAARIAAVIAVIATGVASGWWEARGRASSPQGFREFASAPGSRVTVTLRDGTRLLLGPSTRLRVPGDFGRSTRTVELDGEALFKVVHDARHPFAIRTAHTTVQDVGTTFSVRAYAGDPNERVAVAEGEVAVSGPGATQVGLRAHDLASVDAAGQVTVRRGVDVSQYLDWSQGVLDFKGTPLREAVLELGRTYDLDVTIADSALAGELVTGSFGNDQPADAVLRAVSYVVGAHYTRNGRSVVIRRGIVPASRLEEARGPVWQLTEARPTQARSR